MRDSVAAAALDRSVPLNPIPAGRDVGIDVRGAEPAVHRVFTSLEILAAEDRLLAAADDLGAPVARRLDHAVRDTAQLAPVPEKTSSSSRKRNAPNRYDEPSATQPGLFDIAKARAGRLNTQVPRGTPPLRSSDAAVAALATSGRVVDVLVGAAGAGKSTAMRRLRETWEATFGPGSVTGLAPSAGAARVLGAETAMTAETTAQWVAQQAGETRRLEALIALQRHRDRRAAAGIPTDDLDQKIVEARAVFDRWRMRPDQLVIVDEASMADTKTLDAIVTQARGSGAKVVLVGDDAQLGAVGAGGAFAMLVRARTDPPTLEQVRRFKNADGSDDTAEAAASIRLRDGDLRSLDHYQVRGRIHTSLDGVNTLQQAHAAWKADRDRGLRSIMIAADNATVTALNQIAHDALVKNGQVRPGQVPLSEGATAGVGDRIITRKVDRHLSDGTARARRTPSGALTAGYVTNGAAFTVTGFVPGGGLLVQADGGAPVTLPADYVAQHVQLGYAATAHRAQGATVDTAHVIAAPGMTREAFYVAMTRGRYANHVHVITDRDPDTDQPAAPQTAHSQAVLKQILANTGQQLSAHDTRTALEHQAQQWISRREADAVDATDRTAEGRTAARIDTPRCATTISRSPTSRHALSLTARARPPATQDRSHSEVTR